MGNRAYLSQTNTKPKVIYSDFSDNLDISAMTGQLSIVKNESDVIASLRRILSFSTFEREYEKFGAGLDALLFEPIDDVTSLALQNKINETIKNYEQRVNLDSVLIQPYPDNNLYEVTISFTMLNSTEVLSLTQVLYRIR